MLASTVSSKMLRALANAEGLNFIETLTGFKWMGEFAVDGGDSQIGNGNSKFTLSLQATKLLN